MSGPPREISRARTSVKAALAQRLALLADSTAAGLFLPRVVVGVSGGADSLALAATTHWVASRMGLETEAVIVDHGLNPDSAQISERAALQCERLGIQTVRIKQVEVRESSAGLESAARDARYRALTESVEESKALALLLGHTLDDQAEQVLLGLVRGAGARSLAGIPRSRGHILRPFLGTGRDETTGLWRADTEAICEALELEYWRDPMNSDLDFTRVSARAVALPALREAFGEHITKNLVRTADLMRDDAQFLDSEAQLLYDSARLSGRVGSNDHLGLDARILERTDRAVRTRVIKRAIHEAAALQGEPSTKTLLRRHILQVDSLIIAFHGQGPILLPGKIEAGREGHVIFIRPGIPERTSH